MIFGRGLFPVQRQFSAILPLPPANDLRAARGWGYGASVGAFVLGLPCSLVLVPLQVAIHPFPHGDDASDAWIVAAMLAAAVAINWGLCAAVMVQRQS